MYLYYASKGEVPGEVLAMLCCHHARGREPMGAPTCLVLPSISTETEAAAPRTASGLTCLVRGVAPVDALPQSHFPSPQPFSAWEMSPLLHTRAPGHAGTVVVPLPSCPEHGDEVLGCAAP